MIREYIRSIVREVLSEREVKTTLSDRLLPSLQEKVISYLNKGFDIYKKDTLVPEVGPKHEYTVFECERPATMWFLVDLSEARAGDLFQIKLYVRLSGGEFLLHDHYELEGQRSEPIATLSSRFAPSCRLTVAQTRGMGDKEVRYEVFGRYEGR